MTSFPPEPEFWVEGAANDGSGGGSGNDWGEPGNGRHDGDDGAPPGGPSGGKQPPRPRRWPRWLALAAVLAVISGFIVWQSRANTAADAAEKDGAQTGIASPAGVDPMAPASQGSSLPATESVPDTLGGEMVDPEVLDRLHWELVGYCPLCSSVTVYRPSAKQLVETPVPELYTENPLSVVFTGDAVIIHPVDSTVGSLVRDGRAAEPLPEMLQSNLILPGPDPEHLWVALSPPQQSELNANSDVSLGSAAQPAQSIAAVGIFLVTPDGEPAGGQMDIPDAGGKSLSEVIHPDGAGYALLDGIDGTYQLDPGGLSLITHGRVLATGPTTMLVDDCDEQGRCAATVIDRKSGERRTLTGFTPTAGYAALGSTSPDGHWAAVIDQQHRSASLIDLQGSGQEMPLYSGGALGDQPFRSGLQSTLAFSPDSQFLVIARPGRVELVNTRLHAVVGTLPVPKLEAIAIRPAG